MKKIFFVLSFLLLVTVGFSQNFGLILKTSTSGVGADLGYRINPKWLVKAGFDKFDYAFETSLDEGGKRYFVDAKAGVGSISITTDFKLYKKLYLTGGILSNNFTSSIFCNFSDDVKIGDVLIKKENLGSATWKIKPKQKITPYLGIGVGDNLGGSKRVNFSFEVGAFYQGITSFEIESSGIFSPNSDPDFNQAGELSAIVSDYKIYPVMKLNLGIKLFRNKN